MTLSDKEKGIDRTATNTVVITQPFVFRKVVSHLLLVGMRHHLSKFQRPEQFIFTSGKSTLNSTKARCVLEV